MKAEQNRAISLEGTAGVVSTEEKKGQSQLDTYLRPHTFSDCLIAPQQPHRTLLETPEPACTSHLCPGLAPPTLFFLPQTVPPADVTSLRPREDLWGWGAV